MTKELKKVNYREYKKELERIQNELNNSRIMITDLSPIESDTINLGINWSSIGAVNIEEAEKFSKDMQKAVELVKNFKYNGYETI